MSLLGPLRGDARTEIDELYARYAYAFDRGDVRAWAALFTSDGRFTVPGTPVVVGRPALEAFASERHRRSPDMRHFTSNVLIETSGSAARGRAYVAVYRLRGGQLLVRTMGEYRDKLVEQDDGWRFRSRRYEPWLPAELCDVPIIDTADEET